MLKFALLVYFNSAHSGNLNFTLKPGKIVLSKDNKISIFFGKIPLFPSLYILLAIWGRHWMKLQRQNLLGNKFNLYTLVDVWQTTVHRIYKRASYLPLCAALVLEAPGASCFKSLLPTFRILNCEISDWLIISSEAPPSDSVKRQPKLHQCTLWSLWLHFFPA